MKRFRDFSIRTKFETAFLIAAVLIVTVTFVVFYLLAMEALKKEAEDYYLENEFHSVQAVMANTKDILLGIVKDYANWDEMYNYINTRDETWVKANVTDWVPKNFKVGLILIFDNSGKLLYQYGDFREFSLGSDFSANPLIKQAFASKETKGLYSTSKGIAYIASSQIMHSDQSGPRNGAYLYGQVITEDELKKIKEIIRVDISIISREGKAIYSTFAGNTKRAKNFPDLYQELTGNPSRQFSIYKPDYQFAFIYSILKDVQGKDIGMLELIRPRKSVAVLRWLFIKIFTGSFILVFLIVFITVLLSTRFILRPLDSLNKAIGEIQKTKDMLKRVRVESRDEIGILAENFNMMLGALNKSQNELIEAQQNLIKSEKMATAAELAMGTVHQINNPLSIAIGRLQMLRRLVSYKTPIPEGDLEKDLKIMEEQVKRAIDITNGLLRYAAPSNLRFERCDMNELLKDTVKTMKELLEQKNITVVENYKESLPAMERCDRGQICDVFINIIINAQQAMSGGGKLEISTDYDEQEDMVWAKFKDNGYGIAPEDIGKIFTPFFSTKAERSGLGLAISYNVVKGHRGTIEIESQAGIGSTFIVKLPVGGA
ncbi:HAMP domain-containing protein [bacterium]|nr:MAG: HAMP domain-containing protein [bacterium]